MLERVGEIPRTDDTIGAVVVDPMRRARDEREVIRKAGMRDAGVVRENREARGERVEVGRVRSAEHVLLTLVLEHDHDYVRKARHRWLRSLRAAERGRHADGDRQCQRPLHDSVSARRTRFFQKWSPAKMATARTTMT